MNIITVTSGKGGVGKTNIAVNMAIVLAQKGYKTCLFDADLGLANVNILMGIVGEKNLEDVIVHNMPLADIIIKDWNGIDIIPGSSGIERMESLSAKELDSVLNQFASIDNYDYFICDTQAGISNNVLAFCMAASQVLIPILPEPTSLTDSYSLLKVLSRKGFDHSPSIIVNRSKSNLFGKKLYEKFKKTTEKFLPLTLSYCGAIPEDPQVSDAVAHQVPLVINAPDTPAAKGIVAIVEALQKQEDASKKPLPGSFFKAYGQILKKKESSQAKQPKATEPQKISETKIDAAPPVSDKDFQATIVSTLKSLTDNTSMIISELSQIRRLLIKNGQPTLSEIPADSSEQQGEASKDGDDDNPPVLSLNFEQYVRDRKQNS